MTGAAYWDAQADTFDEAADHGLLDPRVRAAWRDLLEPLLPPAARVADLGCGTGSLSVLLAELGHDVVGLDIAGRMVEAARSKATAAGVPAAFVVGDAASPGLAQGAFDVVLCRHVLWALEQPAEALSRWVRLLAPGGVLVLVEGHWWNGGGLRPERARALVLQHRDRAEVTSLDDPSLWGGAVSDERFLLVSRS